MTNPRNKAQFVSKVNSVPRGLQDLLGNVNQGVNPHELAHQISPGVDLFPFWGVNRLKLTEEDISITPVTGQNGRLTVPAGELWIPVAAAFTVPAAAGDDVGISVGIESTLNTTFTAFEAIQFTNVNDRIVVGTKFPRGMCMPSGWSIMGMIDGSSLGGAARTCTLSAVHWTIKD